MIDLSSVLIYLRPGIRVGLGLDVEIYDDGDGSGPYIARWADPRDAPTAAEIEAAWPDVQAAQARAGLQPLTPRQVRLVLNQSGLLDSVEAAVAAAGRELVIWWEFSVSYERTNPLVIQMAADLGVSPEQVDAIWAAGAQL